MSFLYPYVLNALALPLLLALAALLRHRRQGTAWRRLVSPAHEATLVTRRAPWHRRAGGALLLLALALAIVALARPICGYREAGALTTGRNLLLALDVSRSMETQDVAPSRLEEARAAAYELIDALPEDKIGLIVFSGSADLVVPLTYDHTALREALEQVDRSWATAGGTDFSAVLRRAMQDFERSAPEGTNAVVLLSDGEETVGSARELAAEAKEKRLLVITVGIGTEAGGAIPDPQGDNGLWQDAEGKHVISKLDTASLTAFAEATGGDYFTMGSNTDLAAFARRTVRKLDAHEERVSLNKVPNDRFAPFAAAALAALLLGILCLTEWRLPRRSALLLLLAAAGILPAAGAPSAESLRAYRSGLAAAAQDSDKAKEHFSTALLDEDPAMQAAALYAIGNANTRHTLDALRQLYEAPAEDSAPGIAELERMVESLRRDIRSYNDALAIQPELRPAATNKQRIDELIRRLEEEIERLKQQEQQQQNQQNDPQQQDDQEQNQQNDPQQGDQEQNQQNDPQQGDQEQNQQNDPQQGDQEQNQQNDPQQGDQEQNQQNDPQQGDQEQNQQNDPQQGDQEQNQQNDPQQGDQGQDKRTPSPSSDDKEAPQQQPSAQPELSDKEKAEQRAAAILQMHLDEEGGSPIPHPEEKPSTPRKDY